MFNCFSARCFCQIVWNAAQNYNIFYFPSFVWKTTIWKTDSTEHWVFFFCNFKVLSCIFYFLFFLHFFVLCNIPRAISSRFHCFCFLFFYFQFFFLLIFIYIDIVPLSWPIVFFFFVTRIKVYNILAPNIQKKKYFTLQKAWFYSLLFFILYKLQYIAF